jgi:hypothetical protein
MVKKYRLAYDVSLYSGRARTLTMKIKKESFRESLNKSLTAFFPHRQTWSTLLKCHIWRFTWKRFAICWLVSKSCKCVRTLHSQYNTSFTAQNDNLQIHEEKNKGVYVKGLSDFYVGDQSDVYSIMKQGGLARAVSSTSKL